MAVEWLRSCYTSRWHLFRDDLSQTTLGRYYFSPEGQAFYPGRHNLGSRSWHDANYEKIQSLGESVKGRAEWYSGDLPDYHILPTSIGSASCIENGEDVANGIVSTDLVAGFPSGCIVTQTELDELWQQVSDYGICQVQKMFAFLIVALYASDDDVITKTIRDWLGLVPVVKVHHHAGVLNGLVTITTPDWQVAILDGTRNFQEFALQGFSFIVGPTNFGILSTVPLWYQSATQIIAQLQADGLTPTSKLMLAGHSYGGSVALTIAARLRSWNPSLEINYLTLGVPKIGDQRFLTLVDACNGRNIANDDDIVTILPPDRITLAPIIPLIALPALLLYTEWVRVQPSYSLTPEGRLFWNVPAIIDTPTLFNLITRVIGSHLLDPIQPHYASEYWCRLQRRCPDVEWPISTRVNFDITCPCSNLAIVATAIGLNSGIGFNHPKSIIPGNDCDHAIPYILGCKVTSPIPGSGQEQWWIVDVPAHVSIYFRFTSSSTFVQDCEIWYGASCTVNVTLGSLEDGDCFATPFDSATRCFMRVVGVPPFTGTYTLDVGIGVC